MVEADFQKDLVKGLQSQGTFARKWPDSAYGVVKPFDICMAYGHQFIPIECKLKKYKRIRPLGAGDYACGHKDFEGHQLPGLRRIFDEGQGFPQIAICVIRYHPLDMGRVLEKYAWMMNVVPFMSKKEWLIGDLDLLGTDRRLEWLPKVGWIVPLYPKPAL